MVTWMENVLDGKARTDNRVMGLVLRREACGGTWMFLGTTPSEVGKALSEELTSDEGLRLDEMDRFIIEARLFAPDELANMPEFDGW